MGFYGYFYGFSIMKYPYTPTTITRNLYNYTINIPSTNKLKDLFPFNFFQLTPAEDYACRIVSPVLVSYHVAK